MVTICTEVLFGNQLYECTVGVQHYRDCLRLHNQVCCVDQPV
jgi:hypothetical protein